MQHDTSMSDAELLERVEQLARGLAMQEAQWLALLAEFDRREMWRQHGQLSCVEWLSWNCGMARVTAREKLRVAHELVRRPLIREAFEAGELSYSKVRAITRITDADEQTDSSMLEVARSGDTADVEQAVRVFEQIRDQERGIDDYMARFDRRALRASQTFDGMMVIEAVLPLEEGQEFLANLNVAVDNASAEARSYPQLRVDALMELARAGRGNLQGKLAAGDDRYTVHVVTTLEALQRHQGGSTVEGDPIGSETLRRITCDSAIVRHVLNGRSEPVDIGRLFREWTTAQRRAILVRDGGRCRHEGCRRKTCDVHHVIHWEDGGPTDVSNAVLLCPRHHTMVHEGGASGTSHFGFLRELPRDRVTAGV